MDNLSEQDLKNLRGGLMVIRNLGGNLQAAKP